MVTLHPFGSSSSKWLWDSCRSRWFGRSVWIRIEFPGEGVLAIIVLVWSAVTRLGMKKENPAS